MKQNLVLIPGLNNTSAVFDGLVAALPDSINPVAVDCPAIPSVEGIAAALLPGLPERFWLTGFSFGGYVAMALLAAAPERIQGLALVCTGPLQDRPERIEARLRSIETVRQGGYLKMLEAAAGNTMLAEHLKDEKLIRARRSMVENYGPERYIAHSTAAVARPDRIHLLVPSLPTLIVSTNEDKVYPIELARQYAAQIPHAQFRVIASSGHLVPMEQPEALADVLSEWIQAQQ